ncbi:MAG: hypothetical protein FWC33_07085 [Candidatus Bathyarchaeota archaeon]|nr:hypothetical protein [Candidatus Termiticorpusculum sp.]
MLETRIKICGMDSLETALFCAKNNVDYLGLHLFPEYDVKKKEEKIKLYHEIREKLPNAKLVLVVKTKYPEVEIEKEVKEIFDVCKDVKVDYLQLNRGDGKTSAAHVNEFKGMFKKAGLNIGIIAVLDRNELIVKEVTAVAKVADYLLFESGRGGGSGKTAPDDKLLEILPHIKGVKFFYAGGLDASNVADMIYKIKPFAVDVETSLESPKGIKKQNLMAEFIDIVRNVDENDFNIAWRTVEKENIVSKLKFLTLLETNNPFEHSEKIRLEIRIKNMLNSLPEQHHTAALAVLSNVIYITKQMMNDAWKSLAYQYKHDFKYETRIDLQLRDVHFFELDRDGSRDIFLQLINTWGLSSFSKLNGRLEDKSLFNSVDYLLRLLHILDDTGCLPDTDLLYLLGLMKKKHWVLLVDLSLSGSSVCSEIKKLKFIADYILQIQDLDISIFILTATEEAQNQVDDLLKDLNSSNENVTCYYAIKIPYECAFNAKEKREYGLLKDKELIKKVDELCSYFAKNIIEKFPNDLTQTIDKKNAKGECEEAADIAKYGYGRLGWNVITYKNAPNNSLPFLWCQPDGSCTYKAPFRRVPSRGIETGIVNPSAGISSEADDKMKEWIKSVGLDSENGRPNLNVCKKIYEKYIACLAKHPDIEIKYGTDDFDNGNNCDYDDGNDDVSKKSRIDFVDSNNVIKNMAKSREKVYLISCINHEERSIAFTENILKAYEDEGCLDNLVISPWKLKSDRFTTWSLIGERKKAFIQRIKKLKAFNFEDVLWSDSNNSANLKSIVNKLSIYEGRGYNLVIDLSAMPFNICREFSEKLANDVPKYKRVYIVHTSAKEYLARKGLGPSRVGNINLPPFEKDDVPIALIFPGREGYEAALAIFAFKNKGVGTAVAINLFDSDMLSAFEICYANQLVCSGSIEKVNVYYYYSPQDLQRVLEEFRKHAETVDATHVRFDIFDINWRIISVAFEATKFKELKKIKEVSLSKFDDDVNNSNTHQYHNFYSKGIGLTNMFLVSEKSIESIQKEAKKREKIKQVFDYCNAVVVDACDTIWHDSKYYSKYKESVFNIIKREKNNSENNFRNADLDAKLKDFRDGTTGESAYVKAMESLCRSLGLSRKGLEEVHEESAKFMANPSELFKCAQRALLKIKETHKCIIVTRTVPENFERKKKASKLELDFNDVEFIKTKDEASWKEIHDMLKAKSLRPLYIGNSYKEDIEPHIKLEHEVMWFNYEENRFGREGLRDECVPKDLIQVQSWVEILKALNK